jgi:NADPH2:quinone reductase
MRAIVLQDHGGPEVLRIAEIPDPVPGPEEVLVEVRAAGVNRADISQRQGTYPQPGPRAAHEIPGLEFAGVVAAAGPRVQRHRPGDRVCGLLVGGGYAEKVAVHERMAMRTPDRLSDEEAAAIPEVFLTAYDALLQQAALRAGESVLVHAIGSGVGTAALQLARDAGACVFGTARSEEKCRRALELGAALAVEMRQGDRDFAATIVAANRKFPLSQSAQIASAWALWTNGASVVLTAKQ